MAEPLFRHADARCRRDCGLGLRAVDQLTEAALADMLPPEARLSLALTLAARADRTGGVASDREAWRVKALRLLLGCREDGVVCGSLAETLDRLMRASLDALTAEELFACAEFFREGGRGDWMDNAVFFLWDTVPDRSAWRERLTALYQRELPGLSPVDAADSLARLH